MELTTYAIPFNISILSKKFQKNILISCDNNNILEAESTDASFPEQYTFFINLEVTPNKDRCSFRFSLKNPQSYPIFFETGNCKNKEIDNEIMNILLHKVKYYQIKRYLGEPLPEKQEKNTRLVEEIIEKERKIA